jgi:hypothetical protein
VPDFLLASADRTVRVVNVKPAARLADPAVAEALAWPGELFVARGWGYEVWSGADPALQEPDEPGQHQAPTALAVMPASRAPREHSHVVSKAKSGRRA